MNGETTHTALPASARELEHRLDPGMFRALSDPTRLTLLARLATAPGWLTVTAASSCCGVHLSGVSRHLKALHEAGLIEARREGREMRYRLDSGALAGRLRHLADALDDCAERCAATACDTDACATSGRGSSPEPGRGGA